MNLFNFTFISLASATLQGNYVKKMSNAVASFNAVRNCSPSRSQCSTLNQTFNFLKANARSYEEMSQFMLAYKDLAASVCQSPARQKRRHGFRKAARGMYFKNMQ